MPNQPDSINMQQLHAQLDAIYESTQQPVNVAHYTVHYPEFHQPEFNDAEVADLTEEAKQHTPDFNVLKAQRMAMFGTYIEQLRTHRLRG